MSDPIEKLLYEYDEGRISTSNVTKQIRQQIGSEILSTIPSIRGTTKVIEEKTIREICQLDD